MRPKAKKVHRDFLEAPEVQQFRGELKDLMPRLTAEAKAAAGGWVGVVLPGGAHVGLRMIGEELRQRELRIYRTDPFRSAQGQQNWTAELTIFRRVMGCNSWRIDAVQMHRPSGGPMATLIELDRSADLFEEGADG